MYIKFDKFQVWFVCRLGLAMINLSSKFKVYLYPVRKYERGVQNVENDVVWGSYRSLGVIGSSTIR